MVYHNNHLYMLHIYIFEKPRHKLKSIFLLSVLLIMFNIAIIVFYQLIFLFFKKRN